MITFTLGIKFCFLNPKTRFWCYSFVEVQMKFYQFHVTLMDIPHFNLPNHLKQHMTVCGLSLHLGSSESRKTQEKKFIFQIGTSA